MEIPARVRNEPSYDGPALLTWRHPEHGNPRRVCKIDGHPLEVRVWFHEPAPWYDAVRHPSGVWLSFRFPGEPT